MLRFRSILICLVLALGCNASQPTLNSSEQNACQPDQVITSWPKSIEAVALSPSELVARQASVKVLVPGMGRGSGTYFSYKGAHIVITAAHVVARAKSDWVWAVRGEDKSRGRIIYYDRKEDIAVLLVKPMKKVFPIELKIRSEMPTIGETLTYSGYPGHHDLLTLRGDVSGIEVLRGPTTKIVVHTYGWPGASGSCMFDTKGRLVGILVAIPVGRGYVPQLLESMIYATPANLLNLHELDKTLCKLEDEVRPSFCEDKAQ